MQTVKKLVVFLRHLSLCGLACACCAAQAAVVEELYTAVVERQSDVADQRAAAQSAAMEEVLVRVTGNRMAPLAPELNALLGNPAGYIATFGFPNANEARVSFLQDRIEQELAAAGWPTWGAERPQSILWIAVTDQFGEQAILTADGPPIDAAYSEHMIELLARMRADIEAVAAQRGLPYVLPSFAAAVDMQFFFNFVWNYEFERLADQSAVWDADAIVLGRVRESVIGTDVEWLLQSDALGLRLSYPGTGVVEGVHWLADEYARMFVSGGGERAMTLRINGIQDFDSYARVLAYLESVTMLSAVDVQSWNGSELMLGVISRGDAAVLARILRLDNVLREQTATFPSQPGPIPRIQPGGFGTALDLVVVPERSVFGAFGSGF